MKRISPAALFVDLILLTLGAFLSALSVIVFLQPSQVAPSGVSGVAVILNTLIGTPVGVVILLGNIPIQIIAYRMLGGWRVVAATLYAVVAYSIMIEVLTPYFPVSGVSGDALLNALFGGIVGGIGGGLALRGGGTMGGTSTLGRILQDKYGVPLSSSALYTDGAVVLLAGLVYGWEGALYAIVALWVTGAVTDYVLEGPSVIRTAVIVTDFAQVVSDAVLTEMGRGATGWQAQGMYTGATHSVVYVTVARGQVEDLRHLVFSVDPNAFMVVGQGHSAYGRGFRRALRANLAPASPTPNGE
ncbi:MAG: YitT family protein [Chloroflexota bacterium]|nr:YitT family protein [Chloroflexota bacterium]